MPHEQYDLSQAKKFTYPLTILEAHLDSFGHVNNAAYLSLYEEARWDIITKNGYGLKEIHEKKTGPVVLEVNLKFRRELLVRQKIVIESYAMPYHAKVGKMIQLMKNEKGEVCCEGIFLFGLFDMKSRKLISPTPEWLKAVGWGPQ
jgi:thioesterase III